MALAGVVWEASVSSAAELWKPGLPRVVVCGGRGWWARGGGATESCAGSGEGRVAIRGRALTL